MDDMLRLAKMRRQFWRYRLLLVCRWLSLKFYEVPETAEGMVLRLWYKMAHF